MERRRASGRWHSRPSPFGSSLKSPTGPGGSWNDGFNASHLATWPEPAEKPTAPLPLSDGLWTGGPYKNAAGNRWVAQINTWYQEGTAAGLTQDTFRSLDNGHSSINLRAYPQMNSLAALPDFGNTWENLFQPRATMGVQSYGVQGKSVIEASSQVVIRSFYESGGKVRTFQEFYRRFYENNFLFVAPAVGSFTKDTDAFAFLSPFYLHSIGASGTDARLLKPLVLASAALPPALKTRMLRMGLFAPTLMRLFKTHIASDPLSPEAHAPAYTLPAESADDFEGPSPFLDKLLKSAHDLTHIPPVCRFQQQSTAIEVHGDHGYGNTAYFETSPYAYAGVLRQDQTLVMTVDLRFSWTDRNRPISAYYAKVLRGTATIEPLNKDKSVVKITVPWMLTKGKGDLRTDILLMVNDGAYLSAPAYISVRHLARTDPITLGIKATP